MPNPVNKITFTNEQKDFLRSNYLQLTNPQLADALGMKLTRVRMELYALGLQRIELERWTNAQTDFLKRNFRKIGNRELAVIFEEKFKKNKKWTERHINKKLVNLGLKRNKLDLFLIKERNRDRGCFGNKNLKNKPTAPIVYVNLDYKTRVRIKPNTDVDELKRKFKNRMKWDF